MQFIFDNFLAVLLGMTVLLILTVTNFRGSTGAASIATYQAMVNQSEAFNEVVGRDIRSLSEVVSVEESSSAFRFSARVTPGDTTQVDIEYRRSMVGSRGGAPLYEITRYVDGVVDGKSAPLISEWTIEARADDGTLAPTPADASQVYVLVKTETPHQLAGQQVVGATVWETTLFPPALRLGSS